MIDGDAFAPAPMLGVVLAGGQSRRMGLDKATLGDGGMPRVVTMWRLLVEVVGEAVVSIGPESDASAFADLPTVVDDQPGAGPLAGIVAVHRSLPQHALLIIAVDLFGLGRSVIDTLVERRNAVRWFKPGGGVEEPPDLTALAAKTPRAAEENTEPEPLCAVWETPLLRDAAASFARGERSPRAVLSRRKVKLVPRDGRAIYNVNTPADLAAYRRSVLEVMI